jgi:hypothetical protein
MDLSSYRDRPHWSFSSLNQILNFCSLQWMFEKIERLPRPFTPIGIAMGSAYHRVMENIALHRMEQKLPTEKDTRDLFMSSGSGSRRRVRRWRRTRSRRRSSWACKGRTWWRPTSSRWTRRSGSSP